MFSLLKYLVGGDVSIIMHGLALFDFNAKHLRYLASWHKANFCFVYTKNCKHSFIYRTLGIFNEGWRFHECCKSLSRVKTTIADLKLRFNNSVYIAFIYFVCEKDTFKNLKWTHIVRIYSKCNLKMKYLFYSEGLLSVYVF